MGSSWASGQARRVMRPLICGFWVRRQGLETRGQWTRVTMRAVTRDARLC